MLGRLCFGIYLSLEPVISGGVAAALPDNTGRFSSLQMFRSLCHTPRLDGPIAQMHKGSTRYPPWVEVSMRPAWCAARAAVSNPGAGLLPWSHIYTNCRERQYSVQILTRIYQPNRICLRCSFVPQRLLNS
ncbi:hypothetical protein GE09DRAFT_1140938 [Coniochaeta sp. 2T2.1]|nr:hypothetical protein GE09DRAFT_1140938 [Coniochaeta sp. 2T2.1]